MAKHLSQPARPLPSAEVARALLLKVAEAGEDASAILRNAGLPGLCARWRRMNARTRLTQEQFISIYRECVVILDRYARIDTGLKPLERIEYEMLCHCLITCDTLAEVIERAASFSAMIQHRAGEIALEILGDRAEFKMGSFRVKHDVSAFLSDITGLYAYHRLFGWLIGEDIEPLTIEMVYRKFMEDDPVAHLVPHQIFYDCPGNALIFPARYLGYRVIRSPSELRELLKNFPFDLTAMQSRQTQMSERVRGLFSAALAQRKTPPTTAELADQFSISPTTLKRRLADEGTSIKMIKERCRHEIALMLLSEEHLSLNEVAARVGLSDTTAFSRAFRQWQGQSPTEYRRSTGRVL
ncbi:AraC family transcriptional regulator [Caenibius sp. WL]|uniref:helix-turn-helix transcriptional regulator n=1 Tax=Caenibius sp. WL TaxID=2872646 RepID=UPI001C98FEE8|nr:AraC family transcriptional regulator [Caenibius sp. WL]QZP09532.1 AraC family transcriptional regulator [Caenibius sp. WL]